jgi:hypothetical protein
MKILGCHLKICSYSFLSYPSLFIIYYTTQHSLIVPWQIKPSGPFPSELIWKNGFYRQLIGLHGRVMSPSQDHRLHRTTQTQKKWGQTSMPWMGFEPTIPVFSGRTHLVPHSARPLWHPMNNPVIKSTIFWNITPDSLVESQLTFWRNISPPFSGSNKLSNTPAWKQVTSWEIRWL